MNKMLNKKGFTLIEILIVVAIIGILASVVVVGLGPAQKRGRDARRVSDLRSVQTALELYYGKNGQYPTSGISSWTDFAGVLTSAGIGTNQIPRDPTTSRSYVYRVDAAGTTYVLGAQLEDITGNVINSSYTGSLPDTGIPTSATCGNEGFYCLTL